MQPILLTPKQLQKLKLLRISNGTQVIQFSVSFKGVRNDVRVAVLKVVTPDGGILFKKLQKANEDYSIQLTLPAQYAKVSVQFDGENRTFDTKLGKVEMILN